MDIYQIFISHNRSWSSREIVCFSAVFLLAFVVAAILFYKRKITFAQMTAGLLAILFLAVVFASTVFTRTPSAQRKYMLQLFWSWRRVFGAHSKEMLKENLLNCILLFPLGFLLPVIFRKRIGWLKSFLCGFLVSAVIETCQLVFRRGLFEWDDMIHNGVGCMLGCLFMELIMRNSHREDAK